MLRDFIAVLCALESYSIRSWCPASVLRLGVLPLHSAVLPMAALSVPTLYVWICVVCWVWISVCVPRKAPYRYLWILVASLTCSSAMEPATALERERA